MNKYDKLFSYISKMIETFGQTELYSFMFNSNGIFVIDEKEFFDECEKRGFTCQYINILQARYEEKTDSFYRIKKQDYMLKQNEMIAKYGALIKKALIATKFKKVWARPANGETIVTTTSDGIETINTAKAGDFIIWNQTESGEQYILSANKFEKLYVQTPVITTDGGYEWYQYAPLGQVHALEVIAENNPNTFEASWGEPMKCVVGDFLCCPTNSDEIYRIARKEFFETYTF